MAQIRMMQPLDIFNLSAINLDPFTEQYDSSWYIHYFLRAPDFMQVAQHPNGDVMGYMIGKVEVREDEESFGHISAVSVEKRFRRIGLGTQLVRHLENHVKSFNLKFVDLFVRANNESAQELYIGCGYVTYSPIRGYYDHSDDIDAYDMRHSIREDYRVVPKKEAASYMDY